jgi:hypothetical protein
VLKPYVKCVAEGEVSIVEERVGSDADRALPMWTSMWPSLLMALFQRFWRWLTVISRAWLLIVDEPSSLSEAMMLGSGSIEHGELIYCTVSKSTTFEPPGTGSPLALPRAGLVGPGAWSWRRGPAPSPRENISKRKKPCYALQLYALGFKAVQSD